MLRTEDLHLGYGDIQILRGISLAVRKGEIVSLVGSNGSGKTTLINGLTGLLRPGKGSIYFEDERIDLSRTDEIVKKGLVQVPEGRQLFGKLTVLENLHMGAINERARPQRDESLEMVYKLFPILEERKHQTAGTLSGGEQQMVSIARGLMAFPSLLILDEPSLGLAPIIINQIFDIIIEINERENITVLLVEQNLRASLKISHRAYVLENGKIVLEGTGQELLENEHTKKAFLGL